MSAIEALYIFDEHNNLILDHVYDPILRPPPPTTLLPLYLEQSIPRPSLIYLSSLNPPTLLHAIVQDNILFLSPLSSSSAEPLVVLEFLHRIADALEEFLGSPLVASKITASYDVVAQIVAEMADAGVICQGEANALRDVVETGPGVLKNLLGSIGASSSSPALQTSSGGGTMSAPSLLRQPQQAQTSTGSAIPWRRSNVRHTSNEMYVDIVESLSVTLAPSGRPLVAFVHGSIAFTCKVSGVPDLLLNLSVGNKVGMGGKGEQLRRVMERVVFHPCVRLNRWEKEGVVSFVPPDGRFALAGYEVDLLGPESEFSRASAAKLHLPAIIEVSTGLGANGAEFEVRLSPSSIGATSSSTAAASLQSHLAGRSTGPFQSSSKGDSKTPLLEDLTVHVPIPTGVTNVSDLRASKGEAQWNLSDSSVEWKVPTKEFGSSGAVLRCTIHGPVSDDNTVDEGANENTINGMLTTATYDYTDDQEPYQSSPRTNPAAEPPPNGAPSASATKEVDKVERNKSFMPTAATLSFSVKGWLASGVKVESLLLDAKKSRGLGMDVKPYKGVKYLSVSREGVEVRC